MDLPEHMCTVAVYSCCVVNNRNNQILINKTLALKRNSPKITFLNCVGTSCNVSMSKCSECLISTKFFYTTVVYKLMSILNLLSL